MGEAFAGKILGKKAMLWGALAQSIPDIDFISSFWLDTPSALLAHRGFTHSFLFCGLITLFFALLAERLHRPHNIHLGKWSLFFGGAIFIHIFLDAFNNYGVGWFEPFSNRRISFNIIYVADPFFSIAPFIAFLALSFLNRYTPTRKKWWTWGLVIPCIYLLYCSINKKQIDTEVKEFCKSQQISYSRYLTTPAPLQNWLWYVVAGTDSGYYVGFRSIFDSKNHIDFQYFPRNDFLLKNINDHEEVIQLKRFSQQFYTVEKYHDTLVLNDLRFGQMIGWHKPTAKFVFHYFLEHPNDNTLVVQRGRFEGWNWETITGLMARTKGE